MASAILRVAVEGAQVGAVAGGLGLLGSLAAAPTWLLALGQSVVVVYFTVRGVEKRMARLHTAVNETRGELEELRGRIQGLPCHQPGFASCELKPVVLKPHPR